MIILNILEFLKAMACVWMAYQLKRIADALVYKNNDAGKP